MARKKQKRRHKSAEAPAEKRSPRTRREVLRTALIGGGALLALGGAGTAFAIDFRNKLAEQDLTAIGNGKPTIVQVHDPSCALCTSLQKATRRALRSFEDGSINFRVANITTQAGSTFQGQQGLPHVTLALFDADGRRVQVVRGVQSPEFLVQTFKEVFGIPEV